MARRRLRWPVSPARLRCQRSGGRLWACLALALWAAGASAQTPDLAAARTADPDTSARARPALRVEGVGAEGLSVRPGSVCTVVFRVTNADARAQAVAAMLELPPGWESVLPLRPFTVPGGGHDLQLVSVRVPADAGPGAYRVRYVVFGPGERDRAGAVSVAVPTVRGLALELEDAPAMAEAGAPYAVRLLAVNTGNTSVAVRLDATSNLGAPLRLDSARVWLRPGQLRRLTVTASPGRDLASRGSRVRHVVRVRAQAEDPDQTAASLVAVTELVPAAGEAVAGTALDAEVAVRGVRAGGRTGAQLDAAGAAPLLGGTVEGGVTLTDRDRASVYGDRSRYHLRYAGDGLAVVAGDHVFALSPLTEPGRYGFGVGAQATARALRAGAFYHRPRFGVASDTYGGAFAGLRVSPGAEVRANVLHQRGVRAGDAVTLQATVARSRAASLDAECGLGTSTTPAGGLARACSGQLTVDRPWLSVRTSAMAAEPGFPGRARDVREASASAVARLWEGARVEAALQDRQWGETFGSLATQTYRVGVARPWVGAGQIALSLGGRHVRSGLGAALFDRRDVSVQVVASGGLGRLGLRGTAEVGRADDVRRGERGPFQRVQARARLALGGRQSVHVGLEHRAGQTLYGAGEGRWRADLGAALGTARTRLSLNASAALDRGLADATWRRYALVQARAEHTLPSGHRIELDGRRLATDGAFAAVVDEVRASYVVPLRLAAPARSGSTVRGRVYDAETGAGIASVAVTMGGRTAFTDADGAFVLPRPAEGTGYLRLDRVGAGIDRVPLREMPLAVPGGTDAVPDLEIPMLRGARLSGRFRVAPDSASGGVLRAVLEMESAGRRLRTVADRDGRFAFDAVPPGDWTLRVLHAELPRHHAVERDAYAVSLAPGEHGRLEIGVRPRQRPIRLVGGGTVVATPSVPSGAVSGGGPDPQR